jgi:hypothetical protein
MYTSRAGQRGQPAELHPFSEGYTDGARTEPFRFPMPHRVDSAADTERG